MDKIIIGIDLGTTYSAMAYVDDTGFPKIIENNDGDRTTPSVVYFEDNGNVVVGREAKSSLGIDPDHGVELAKRAIAQLSVQGKKTWEIYNKAYTPEEISSFILKKFKQDASAKLGKEITDAVITVPAYFDAAAREATKNAGILAGLNVIRLLNEPESSAIAFVYGKIRQPETVFVYDLGGGTFDVTILKYDGKKAEVIATDGDHRLGGSDFDRIIVTYISNKALEDGVDVNSDIQVLQNLKEEAERAKITLSTKDKTKIRVQNKQYEITREQYQELIKQKLLETEVTMNKVLEAAKQKGISGWNAIDRILLVGGSSKTPAARELVKRVTGKEPDVSLNPDEAVALGAATYAKIYQDVDKTVEDEVKQGKITASQASEKKLRLLPITSVCSHSLGVIALNEQGVKENTIIIPKNTPVDESKEYDFGTAVDNARSVSIKVVLGESTDPEKCSELGEASLQLDGTLPKYAPIRVRLKYNLDGRLEVYGEDMTKGHKISTTLTMPAQMNAQELDSKRQELAQRKIQ